MKRLSMQIKIVLHPPLTDFEEIGRALIHGVIALGSILSIVGLALWIGGAAGRF